MILIVDFGSQTTHLIGRRVRELGEKIEIVLPELALKKARAQKPRGIIFSGGPASVYTRGAPRVDSQIFTLQIPILGICYGLQLIAYLLGGKVVRGKKEFGPALFRIAKEKEAKETLFWGLPEEFSVWMSHGDEVVSLPSSFRLFGSTSSVHFAAFGETKKNIFGLQFHPEVHHTPLGKKILQNFLERICLFSPVQASFPEEKALLAKIKKELREKIGQKKAVCALSGGIDSTLAAYLTYEVIGKNLTCLFLETGLMRINEKEEIEKTYREKVKLPLKIVLAEGEFLKALKGVVDPEEKRKKIGETFIRVLEKEAKNLGAEVLVQGTIYPDVIESKGSKLSAKIKTHHNVGGIPSKHKFKIIEPLRFLYKDEVRNLAEFLGFPREIIYRQVFPGPGLAVRIIGEVTKKKLGILRQADQIVAEEIQKAGLSEKVWMAFAIFTGIKTTGVAGDERKYGETIALRIIESKDTMTADWARVPYPLLAKISHRLVTEVEGVVRVVYDITTKPPATMEWE